VVDEVTLGIVHSWEDVRGLLDPADQGRVEALQTDTKDMAVDRAVGSVRTAIRGQLEAGVDLHALLTTGDSRELPDDVAPALSHALDVVKSRRAVRDYYKNKGGVLARMVDLGEYNKSNSSWGELEVKYRTSGVTVLLYGEPYDGLVTNEPKAVEVGLVEVTLDIDDSPDAVEVLIQPAEHTVVDFR